MTIYDLPGTNGAWERRKQFGFPWSELAERVYIRVDPGNVGRLWECEQSCKFGAV